MGPGAAVSGRIQPELRDELTSLDNEVYFSDVSLLEIVIKHELGKLRLPKPLSALILPLACKHKARAQPFGQWAWVGADWCWPNPSYSCGIYPI